MAGVPCETDFDCRENELCYTFTSWFSDQDLSVFKNNTIGCSCNTFFAWEGEDCDQLSTESYVFVGWNVVLIVLQSYCIFLNIRSIRCFYQNNGGFKLTAGMITSILALLAAIGFWLWSFDLILGPFLTSGPFLGPEDYTSTDPYKGRWNFLGYVGAGFGGLAGAVAAVTVSLMWIETAKRVVNMSLKRADNVETYKKSVRVFLFLAFLALISAGIYDRLAGRENIIGFVMAPFLLIMVITYSVGSYRFSKLFGANKAVGDATVDSNRPREEAFTAVMMLVRRTSIHMCISLCIIIISSLIFSAVDLYYTLENEGGNGYKEVMNPSNSFSWLKIVYMFQLVGFTYSTLVISRYVDITSSGRINKSGSPARSRLPNTNGTLQNTQTPPVSQFPQSENFNNSPISNKIVSRPPSF